MSQLFILAGVFLGTVGVLIGGYLYINRSRLSATDAALRRLRERESSTPSSVRSIIREANVSDLPALDRFLAGRGITAYVAEQLQKAGDTGTPGAFLLRLAIFVAFMVTSSSRFVPMSALSSRVPGPAERARYMSLQSCEQHMASEGGAILASTMLES